MAEKNRGCCDSSCSEESCEGCSSAAQAPVVEKGNAGSSVKKVIGVVSGKGGVGKSLVTSLLACISSAKGFRTAIMDADVTGPSIPKVFGIEGRVRCIPAGILPMDTKNGVKVMSTNLLLENVTDPLIWRGAMITNIVKQFWNDVAWGDVDVMFIDMPPGTGDVPLTVFQSIPVDGIIVVTSPQELVSMIVAKAVNMAKSMNIPIIGIVENMSYATCPDCGKEIKIFGESRVDAVAKEYGISDVDRIPMNPEIASACDRGDIENFSCGCLNNVAAAVEKLEPKREVN